MEARRGGSAEHVPYDARYAVVVRVAELVAVGALDISLSNKIC